MESLLADARNNLSGVKDSTGGRWNLDPPGSFGDSQSHRQHALSERELSALEGIQFIAEHHRDERDDFQVSARKDNSLHLDIIIILESYFIQTRPSSCSIFRALHDVQIENIRVMHLI